MFRRNMSYLVFLATLLAGSGLLAAPNLVPNPSFEQVSQCPSAIDLNTGQVHRATSWSRAQSTPDFFHHCGLISSVETPANAMGSQCPYGSNCGSTLPGGYAGFVAFQAQATDAREMLQSPLSSPLVAGFKYRVRFHVSLAEFFEYGVDRLGAHLRTGAVDPFNVPAMSPQVENTPGSVITDKSNWTMVSGTFTASGGEDHIVLGNLASDANTMALSTGSGGFAQAYYYIDMVSVRRADITDIAILPPGDGGDIWEARLTGGAPNSPAWLYCSSELGGSEVSGQEMDLGGTPISIAQATTDAQGAATFSWSMSAASACANVLGKFHLEARVEDPASGEHSDSNEQLIDTTPTDVAPGGLQAGRFGHIVASPNPFNPQTTLSVELLQAGPVHIELFDVTGRSVRVLANRNRQLAGVQTLQWSGVDRHGREVSAGTYYCRIRSGGVSRTLSLVLVK